MYKTTYDTIFMPIRRLHAYECHYRYEYEYSRIDTGTIRCYSYTCCLALPVDRRGCRTDDSNHGSKLYAPEVGTWNADASPELKEIKNEDGAIENRRKCLSKLPVSINEFLNSTGDAQLLDGLF